MQPDRMGAKSLCRGHQMRVSVEERTCDLLASVKCRMLGVVLNAVDSSAPDYYYSYRYYPYSYGYGPQESVSEPHDDEAHALAVDHQGDRDDDAQVL